MYLGRIVELTSTRELFGNPLHPYTEALLAAVPVPDPKAQRKRIILAGDVPSPIKLPTGCRFHTRCPYAFDRCRVEEPMLKEARPAHLVAPSARGAGCHRERSAAGERFTRREFPQWLTSIA